MHPIQQQSKDPRKENRTPHTRKINARVYQQLRHLSPALQAHHSNSPAKASTPVTPANALGVTSKLRASFVCCAPPATLVELPVAEPEVEVLEPPGAPELEEPEGPVVLVAFSRMTAALLAAKARM